jgi:hypothetical protein
MNLQMELCCRYFTESWKIFTEYATITDVIISSLIYQWKHKRNNSISIFRRIWKKLLLMPLSLMKKCRRNYSVGIFPAGIFFDTYFPSVKPLVFIFFTDCIWNYRRMVFQRMYCVGELVGKIFTNKMVILRR